MDALLGALTTGSSPLALLLADVFQKMTEITQNFLLRANLGSGFDVHAHAAGSNRTTEPPSSVPGDLANSPPTTGSLSRHDSYTHLPGFSSPALRSSSDEISELGLDLWGASIAPNLGAAYEPLTLAPQSLPAQSWESIELCPRNSFQTL